MLKLVKETDPILKERSQEFDFNNPPTEFSDNTCKTLITLKNELLTFMKDHNGIGLAAPQVGLSLRLFVMDIDGDQQIYINPRVKEYSNNEIVYAEGCLSFPGLSLKIKRPESITAVYQHPDGTQVTEEMHGLKARCFLHELDHLDGITFDMKASKVNLQIAREKRRKFLKKLERKDF